MCPYTSIIDTDSNVKDIFTQTNGDWILLLDRPYSSKFNDIIEKKIVILKQYLFVTTLIMNLVLFVYLLVFNTTFNNISVISWRWVLLVEETTDLSQVTDKLYHVML